MDLILFYKNSKSFQAPFLRKLLEGEKKEQ